MSKQIINLSGVLDEGFKVIPKKGSAFGFVVEYKGNTYEPNLSLHLIENSSKHNYSVSTRNFVSFDDHSNGFENVQGHFIDSDIQ